VSPYETRLVPEIREAAAKARAAEVARCVSAFESDPTMTWTDLLLGYRPPIVEEAKRACMARGTYPRKDSRGVAHRHSGRW
jgi:hypothetical protein